VTTRLPIGTTGQYLRVAGGLPAWSDPDTLRQNYTITDDFTGGATPFGETNWTVTRTTGTVPAAVTAIANTATTMGIVSIACSNTNQYSTLHKSITSLRLAIGPLTFEYVFYLDTLATAAQDYVVRIGLGNSATNTAPTNGVYLEYNRAVSTFFQAVTVAGGTETRVDTNGIIAAVAVNQLYRLRVEINALATEVKFYIRATDFAGVETIANTLVATTITNIPAAVNQPVGMFANIDKTAGVQTRLLYIDYAYLNYILTTSTR
jgi:hypothetical protein